LPAILNWYYLEVGFTLYFISFVSSIFFIFMTRGTRVYQFSKRNSAVYIYVIACMLSLCLIILGGGGVMKGLFAFVLILMSLSFAQCEFKRNLLIFFGVSFGFLCIC